MDNLGCILNGHLLTHYEWDQKAADSGYIGVCDNCHANVERDWGDIYGWRPVSVAVSPSTTAYKGNPEGEAKARNLKAKEEAGADRQGTPP